MKSMMLSKNTVTVFFITILFCSSIFSFSVADSVDGDLLKPADDVVIIRIVQYPDSSNSGKNFQMIFDYSWSANNTTYKFAWRYLTKEELRGGGEKPLNAKNDDVLVLGSNYFSYLVDGWASKAMVNNVKTFLAEGGGFLGTCAGTDFVSQGWNGTPKDIHSLVADHGCLGVVDVYLNHDLNEEMQYCQRSKSFMPPINNIIERYNGNPIFATYPDDTIDMTYGGGGTMYLADVDDPMLGDVVPLLTCNEELGETAPIHHWHKRVLGWVKGDPIHTGFVGQWSAVASTYNNSGRIVTYTAHPEIPLYMNGTVEERIEKRNTFSSFGLAPMPVYYLIDGEYLNISKNWWVHRRSAAWAAGVPDDDLPPANELMAWMIKPMSLYNQFYFRDSEIGPYFNFSLLDSPFNLPRIQDSPLLSRIFGRFVSNKLMDRLEHEGMSIVVGDITVTVYAEGSDVVDFYLDGDLVHTATQRTSYNEGMSAWVFEWKLDTNGLSGVHRLETCAYDEYGNYVADSLDVLIYSL